VEAGGAVGAALLLWQPWQEQLQQIVLSRILRPDRPPRSKGIRGQRQHVHDIGAGPLF